MSRTPQTIVTLDLEGVLVPGIWMAVAEKFLDELLTAITGHLASE